MTFQHIIKSIIFKKFFLFLSGIIATYFYSCTVDKEEQSVSTYCNPINIDYTYSNVNTLKGLSYRSGADPACVKFKGEYYLFVTRSFGYWHSKDLLTWDFIHPQSWYFESSNAPAAWSYKDSILISMGNPSKWQCVIYTDDPKKGTWKGVSSLIPIDIHDPALFVDDDNRVYIYIGSSNVFPIKGVELDPSNFFLPKGGIKDLFTLHPKEHGWERFGEYHSDSSIAGYIEGAWMTKQNGIYYLQYAAPGTEWNVYGDGVYTSDNPLGPFIYAEYNPFSYKPGGFITGAGHGSTIEDQYGNYWHFGTMVIGINYKFERRIGMFPAGIDSGGELYANTAYGDYPHYIIATDKKNPNDLFTGWMLLSYKKPVKASSILDYFVPENVTDENIKTVWAAKTNSKEEWLTIDLEKESEVKAIQVNFSDYKSNIFGKRDTIYHQYLIECSNDKKNWKTLIDKSKNKKDVPNDYVELGSQEKTRFIRFTNIHFPTPYLAISDLRIFGNGFGDKPVSPVQFIAIREKDRRTVKLKWNIVEDAQGYTIYFGIDPGKLYNSVMVYNNTSYQLNSLNVKPNYYFSIEAFNENGISQRTSVVKID